MTPLPGGHGGATAASEARRPSAPRLSLTRPDDPTARTASGAEPTRQLRVVHCLDGFGVGGTELNAVRTLERLDPARFETTLVTLNERGPLRERFERAGVRVRTIPITSLYAPRTAYHAAAFAGWLRRERIDVVHCHDLYTNIFAAACARAAGVPLVIASRRWWNTIRSPAHAIANRIAYRHVAHRVLANSPAVGRLLREEGVPAEKLAVIPNFVDDNAFEPLDEARRWRELGALGVPPGAVVVGVVAVLRPEKDLGSLLEAMRQVAAVRPDVHLVLIGSGECEAELRAAVHELGLAHRVHFAGLRPSYPNPHLLLDVSVLCSLHEGFPNTVIEAMAAARPVIATAVGGVPDAVRHDVTGLLVQPRKPDELAAAILKLAEDAPLRARFGEAGRAHAEADYRADHVLERLAALYRTAVPAAGLR